MLTHIGSPFDVTGLRLLTGNGDKVACARERFDLEWEEVRQPTPDDLRLLEMTAAGILPVNASPAAALPAHERLFTLDQVRAAFWKEFHGSGEKWFPYSHPADDEKEKAYCTSATEDVWSEFQEVLEEQVIVGIAVPADKDARIAALEKEVALLENQLEQAARYPGDR
jgi:hypothetical protein